MLALLLLLIGVGFLSVQDLLVKFVAGGSSFWQLQTVRSCFNLGMIVLLAMLSGGIRLIWPQRIRPALARALMLALCMMCFFGMSQKITVAQMATGLYTYPLFVTLLAGPFLGEKIGMWRLAALLLGAVGCLVVLDPLTDDFALFQALPVLAGFFYACNILILRRYCRNESPLALVFIVSLIFFLSGFTGVMIVSLLPLDALQRAEVPFLLVGWPDLTLVLILLFLGLAILNLFGNLCLSRAYQTADSSRLAPLDFSYLLFIAIWSGLLFDSWPSLTAMLGMVLIAIAGIITAIREKRHHKPVKGAGNIADNLS